MGWEHFLMSDPIHHWVSLLKGHGDINYIGFNWFNVFLNPWNSSNTFGCTLSPLWQTQMPWELLYLMCIGYPIDVLNTSLYVSYDCIFSHLTVTHSIHVWQCTSPWLILFVVNTKKISDCILVKRNTLIMYVRLILFCQDLSYTFHRWLGICVIRTKSTKAALCNS